VPRWSAMALMGLSFERLTPRLVSIFINLLITHNRRNCGHQEDEEKVLQMGAVRCLEGNPISNEAIAPKHCTALWSRPRKKHTPLRLWIFRSQRVPVNERATQVISWGYDSKHYVLIVARADIHAQTELLAQRLKAREPPLLPSNSKNCGLWVSLHFILRPCSLPLVSPKKSTPNRPSQITSALDGTVRLRFCCALRITTPR